MTRPRLRSRARTSRSQLLSVPVASLLPLWSLAGGFAHDEDDEDELIVLRASA